MLTRSAGAAPSRAFGRNWLFGAVVIGALLAVAPALVLWSLPLTLGYLVAIPFAVLTSKPAVREFLVRRVLRDSGGARGRMGDRRLACPCGERRVLFLR